MVSPKGPRARLLPSIYFVVFTLASFTKASHQCVYIKVRGSEETKGTTALPPSFSLID